MLKELPKLTLRDLAILTVSPLLPSHWLYTSISGANRSLESNYQLLSLAPGITGNYFRVTIYCCALERCDPTATICFGTLFSKTGARLGKHVYVCPRYMLGLVTLEDDSLMGPVVQIFSDQKEHGFDRLNDVRRGQTGTCQRIGVGQDS
ncbi:hypothetical protein OAF37_03120 [Rubripirellula sp.]|nr:hypothetical protein [Rhodopirellula sp.]MDB4645028.1 hypothetical protein [Rubripirellula sp.]